MKRIKTKGSILLLMLLYTSISITAQSLLNDTTFAGLKLRNIGPALMSGRIADVAIHPCNENTWYVAVGSGGVWKTVNAGTTWQPIFDNQNVYSTGCITIDSNNPHVIWLGTGENVGGRHVSFGDGIYKSEDDGATWKNMGLKESQHISKIIVHPENSNTIWVAAQGPLWNKGGERGIYKSTDGGLNWKQTLGDNEWVGATDLLIDPRNPNVLYAATWQRHRNVAAYMGGGPGTAIYRSDDGGDNWQKLSKGLPTGNLAKIGLAISPQQPDVVYAAIELNHRKGGLFRSSNKGASWSKMSNAVSGATGPHYYQELYACPHQFDKLYLVDVRMQISTDGGKTFKRMAEEHKHSDNHSIAFKKNDPNYLLVGTDGGLYETFDATRNWKYVSNLPVTQFYKVAVDDAEPFYHIYGGTQDNNTQGGPSRTDKANGITNADWYLTLFADGHQPATEPGNPNIIYNEWQEGNLVRVDKTNGEIVHIQPQPLEGDPFERYNWDAPILVSPHQSTRLYFASQRVWRSDNRGDSWTAISGDLTKNEERMSLPIMGSTQSWDNAWDFYAMSTYNTITSLAESPLQEGLIYAGTDDGQISMTDDGGENWRTITVDKLPGVPETAFVNDIKADLFDANTVYISLDNHKFGDFNPYILKSTDKGKSWKSISGDLPDKTLVWRFVQDHINSNLCFIGTEFGLYFTINGGDNWIKLKGNVPTISFRDLAIQRRENDLVAASFGRGFFVLDDYSALRDISEERLNENAILFSTRKALKYIPRPGMTMRGKGSQGAGFFSSPNPDFGAVFTYYLKDDDKLLSELRQKEEKKALKKGDAVAFPGWEQLEAERRQDSIKIWLTIKDESGDVIRRLRAPLGKGFHRVAWDLRYAPMRTIAPGQKANNSRSGYLAPSGTYLATLSKEENGIISPLSSDISFEVAPLYKGYLEALPESEINAYITDLQNTQKEISAINSSVNKAFKQIQAFELSAQNSKLESGELESRLHALKQQLFEIDEKLNGNASKNLVGEKTKPSINSRIQAASTNVANNTYGPTATQKQNLVYAQKAMAEVKDSVKKMLDTEFVQIMNLLLANDGPWVEGMPLP
ncbi:VPS10 domain-containing protein [Carboxylicivirga marina]|uniref:Glycosyl hydrolase n=1 Tax=Carboxylicivirga marina TaxID=2800988 RepID=A0ABS1HMH1_9BACT|nr:glycosyl hydrolase [Carboxylicivirga marina]MBK3518874.1 glycosyl hydrolase [Carboxylicivirga marina]